MDFDAALCGHFLLWLGLGLWLGLAAMLLLRPLAVLGGLRRHAGLVVVCLGLTLLAVTGRVGLGGAVLVELGEAPGLFEQFRSSGRFFWPVGAALLLGVAVLLARQGRLGVLALAGTGPGAVPGRHACPHGAA